MAELLAYDRASMFSAAELDNLKAHGAIAVTGYITGSPGGSAHVNKAYVDLVLSKGLGFHPNWELGASYLVTCGRAGGVSAGTDALNWCRADGLADDGSIAASFSWDTSIGPALYPTCGLVADGIIQGLGGHYLFTAYGQAGLIDYFVSTGRIKKGVKGWLSMSEGFPGFWTLDANGNKIMNTRNIGMVQQHHANGIWFNPPVGGTDVDVILDVQSMHMRWPSGSPYTSGKGSTDMGAFELIKVATNPAIYAFSPDGCWWLVPNTAYAAALAESPLCAASGTVSQARFDACKAMAAMARLDPTEILSPMNIALAKLPVPPTTAQITAIVTAALAAQEAVTLTPDQITALSTSVADAVAAKLPPPATYTGTYTSELIPKVTP